MEDKIKEMEKKIAALEKNQEQLVKFLLSTSNQNIHCSKWAVEICKEILLPEVAKQITEGIKEITKEF